MVEYARASSALLCKGMVWLDDRVIVRCRKGEVLRSKGGLIDDLVGSLAVPFVHDMQWRDGRPQPVWR